MSNLNAKGVIVVGIDGCDGSRRAMRWAVDEALQRGCAVEAVTAWPARQVDSAEPTETGPTETGPTDTGPTDTGLTDAEAADARRQADEKQRHVVDSVLRPLHDAPPVSYE